jgi:hypothetical protein
VTRCEYIPRRAMTTRLHKLTPRRQCLAAADSTPAARVQKQLAQMWMMVDFSSYSISMTAAIILYVFDCVSISTPRCGAVGSLFATTYHALPKPLAALPTAAVASRTHWH